MRVRAKVRVSVMVKVSEGDGEGESEGEGESFVRICSKKIMPAQWENYSMLINRYIEPFFLYFILCF